MTTVLVAMLVFGALLTVAGLAVLAVLDDQRVRRTDELMERLRADALEDDDLGDDVVRMLAAWRDEVQR
jgi:type II secretory pathway pseudopilin PulG